MGMQLIHKGIALDREDRRTIWRIVLPSLVELVFTQLFAMVDKIGRASCRERVYVLV